MNAKTNTASEEGKGNYNHNIRDRDDEHTIKDTSPDTRHKTRQKTKDTR